MTCISLPPRLDTPAASPLAEALRERIEAGHPLDLQAGDVAVVGLACLQVLGSARNTAVSKGLAFSLAAASDALRESCKLAGLELLLVPHHQGSPA